MRETREEDRQVAFKGESNCILRRIIEVIRWLLVIPAGAFGLYLAVTIPLLLHSFTDGFGCYAPQFEGHRYVEKCLEENPWKVIALHSSQGIFAVLAGFLLVSFSALMAPRRKVVVSLVAFLGGSFWAMSLTAQFGGQTVTELLFALVGGIIACWLIAKRSAKLLPIAK